MYIQIDRNITTGYALGRIEEPEAPLFIQASVLKGICVNLFNFFYVEICQRISFYIGVFVNKCI
jgi:hypothetical protein